MSRLAATLVCTKMFELQLICAIVMGHWKRWLQKIPKGNYKVLHFALQVQSSNCFVFLLNYMHGKECRTKYFLRVPRFPLSHTSFHVFLLLFYHLKTFDNKCTHGTGNITCLTSSSIEGRNIIYSLKTLNAVSLSWGLLFSVKVVQSHAQAPTALFLTTC